MPPDPAVAVAVVTRNSARLLPGFFASLPAALAGVAHAEVTVADNASADDTAATVTRLAPGARFIQLGRNAGYSAGINAAVAASAGDGPVLVLNPDIRLGPGSVRRLLGALDDPYVGIAVPRLVDNEGRLALSLRREPTVRRMLGEAVLGGTRAGRFPALGHLVTDPASYERPGTADWATGAAMLLSRRCLDAVGPWDETFFLYAEETDFALRARDLGFALRFVPDAHAVHLGGASHESPRLWTILTLNRIRLFSRRHGRLHTAAYWCAVALNETLRAAAGRRTHAAALAAMLLPSRRPPELAA